MSAAESDTTSGCQNPLQSGLRVVGHVITETSFVLDERDHYPYECPESQCVQDEARCQNKCCRERLDMRYDVLEASKLKRLGEGDTLQEETDVLIDESDSPWIRLGKGHCEIDFGITPYGLCQPDGFCKSCDVEGLTRLHEALDLRIAVQQARLDSRNARKQMKQHGENEKKAQIGTQQERMNSVKRSFTNQKKEITVLAKQLELLSGEEPRYHRDFMVTIDDSYIEASTMPQAGQCSCQICQREHKIRSHQMAVERAEKHKLRLRREIEGRQSFTSMSSSLEIDQTGSTEAAYGGFEFTPTGSYRGHGAREMKPRRL